MFLLQTAQAPIPVSWGPNTLLIPKMDLGMMIEWGAIIQAHWMEIRAEGLTDLQRREYLQYNPPLPPTIPDLKAMVRTADGANHLLRTQLYKAKVIDTKTRAERPPLTEDQVEEIIKANGLGALSHLAWLVADLNEDSLFRPEKEEGTEDPLPSSGKAEVRNYAEIGAKNSPSSVRRIPVPTPSSSPGQPSSNSSENGPTYSTSPKEEQTSRP